MGEVSIPAKRVSIHQRRRQYPAAKLRRK